MLTDHDIMDFMDHLIDQQIGSFLMGLTRESMPHVKAGHDYYRYQEETRSAYDAVFRFEVYDALCKIIREPLGRVPLYLDTAGVARQLVLWRLSVCR